MPVLDVAVPTGDGSQCITWCVHRNPLDPYDPVCVPPAGVCRPGSVSVETSDTAYGSVAWPDRESLNPPCDEPCRLAACPEPGGAVQ
ncbi:hypothetical protein [Streptomyces chrestomyceticus]|uniref:hypothetical protein n=1 Tax=Streptomyces chrestomyceticus TaxID=68185 RepID=UPI00379E80F6